MGEIMRRRPASNDAETLRASRRLRRDITRVHPSSEKVAAGPRPVDADPSRRRGLAWAPPPFEDVEDGRMKRTVFLTPQRAGAPGAVGARRMPTGFEDEAARGGVVARRHAASEAQIASQSSGEGASRGDPETTTLRSGTGCLPSSAVGRRPGEEATVVSDLAAAFKEGETDLLGRLE